MTTQQLVAFIQKKISGFTPSEILLLINEVHYLILSNSNFFKHYIDPATGMPPFITTVNGTYEYELPANARVSLAIFTRDLVGYQGYNYNYPMGRYQYGSDEYYDIPHHKIPAYGNNRAKVIFKDNPPTTSDRYYSLYAAKPTTISAPTIQLDLPAEFHMDVRFGVLALARDEKYGDKSDWQYFERVSMPKIQDKLNAMCRVSPGRTMTQPEYKDYAMRHDYR